MLVPQTSEIVGKNYANSYRSDRSEVRDSFENERLARVEDEVRSRRASRSHTRLEVIVKCKLDIFRKLPDGQLLWVKAVEGLGEARSQLARLAQMNPGDYLICVTRFGCKLRAPEVSSVVSQGSAAIG